jgi:hypothetical protein
MSGRCLCYLLAPNLMLNRPPPGISKVVVYRLQRSSLADFGQGSRASALIPVENRTIGFLLCGIYNFQI